MRARYVSDSANSRHGNWGSPLPNARYQKCALVTALAASLQIELLYLPAYSPNLNLIERLWKFVKKTCLYSTYYANFHDFKQAISDGLAQTHTTYKKELDSLLTLKLAHVGKQMKIQVCTKIYRR